MWNGLNKEQRQKDAEAEAEVKVDVTEDAKAEDEEGVVGQAVAIAQGEEAAMKEEEMTNAA